MKIKEGFKLRKVCDSWIIVTVGKARMDLNGMATLNETGEFLWKMLEKGAEVDEMAAAFADACSIDLATAEQDVKDFVKQLEENGILA